MSFSQESKREVGGDRVEMAHGRKLMRPWRKDKEGREFKMRTISSTSHLFMSLTLFLLATQTFMLKSVSACVFPAFVQTNGTEHVWKGRTIEQNTESSLKYRFNVRTMTAESTDPSVKSFTRICVQAYGADKFLVAHEESGQSGGRYTCVQILQRGNGLVQLKVAPLSKRLDRSLCNDDQLLLDDWVLMDDSRIKDSRVTCSLEGGYEMSMYDNRMHQGVCDGNKGETRMEGECEHGEGITFYFRQTTCVPDGMYMYAEQRVVCLANWQESHWTFTLIKHEKHNYMWILRFPTQVITNGVKTFTMHLFKDLVAESSDIVKSTDNYVKIVMVQSQHQVMGQLCIDDYEICTVLKDPCEYSDAMKLTCSQSCGVCNETNPRMCTFKHNLQGGWYDAVDSSKGSININASMLNIDQKHHYQCVDWHNFAPYSEEENKNHKVHHRAGEEKVMVVTYTNGCRARYACARFVQNSPAAFFFQVSQSRRWPLISMAKEKISCSKFDYEHDSNGHGPKIRYRSKHLRMLVPASSNLTVTCDLENFWYFDVLFKDDVKCSGEMIQAHNGTRDSVSFHLPDCPAQKLLRDTYTCVEFSQFQTGSDKLLITRNAGDPGKIYCWIFPQRQPNTIHLVEAAQCNEISKRRIRRGRLRPLATFSKRKRALHKIGILQSVEKVLNETIEVIELEAETSTSESVDVTQSIRYDVVKNGNKTTHDTSGESSTSNPLVVAAVVITLMIFQIPILCKCRQC